MTTTRPLQMRSRRVRGLWSTTGRQQALAPQAAGRPMTDAGPSADSRRLKP